jgi:toluene monooxygenase system protein B
VSAGQLLPVNAKFGNDFVTQLVLISTADTMDEVAGKVAYHVVGRRVKKRDAPMAVHHKGKVIPAATVVADSGIGPLDYVFVDYAS